MTVYAEIVDGLVVNSAVFTESQTPGDVGLAGYWVLTDAATTKKAAAPGDRFHDDHADFPDGAFTPPRPYEAWRWDENRDWQPPVDKPYPDGWGEPDSGWKWDEVLEEWVDHNGETG